LNYTYADERFAIPITPNEKNLAGMDVHDARDFAIGWLADSLALRAGSLIDPLKYQGSGGMYT
jgi:hypothetical protein